MEQMKNPKPGAYAALNNVLELHPQHYQAMQSGEIRRISPKLKGKAAVKAAKRARQAAR